MLDKYIEGAVSRVSPEGPVLVLKADFVSYEPGGAANVAANIKNLGGTPILCSVIGKDKTGDILISLLKKLNISTTWLHKSENRITTNKTRIVGNNHQMLRIDEEIKSKLGIDQNTLLLMIYEIFKHEKIDCILFQDYDKGIINEEIINIVSDKAKLLNIPVIVDPKKNNFNFYKNVTLFKPNLKEFKDSMNTSNLENGAKILHKRGIEIVFITLSENGIFVSYKKDNKTSNRRKN
jgi:rfaE bifunctional protein kinase chain/domain